MRHLNLLGLIITICLFMQPMHSSAAVPGTTWDWAHPTPQGHDLSDVMWDGSRFIAVGLFGTIVSSPDGVSWTTAAHITNNNLLSITWDGTRYVTVGSSGTIFSSTDLINWTLHASGTTSNLKAITWGAGMFVAMGSGAQLTSTDGINWSLYTNTTPSPAAVVWGTQGYVAVGPGIYTSTDGYTWIDQTASSGFTGTVTSVVWDGSQYVAAADTTDVWGSGAILTSSDAMTWTVQKTFNSSLISLFLPSLVDIAWNGQFYTVINNCGRVSVSSDTINWSSVSPTYCPTVGGGGIGLGGFSLLPSPQSIASNSATTVITAGQGQIKYGTPSTPSTWQMHSQLLTDAGIGDVVWNGSKFIAIGGNSSVFESADGIEWIELTQDTGFNSRFYDNLIWTGTEYFATYTFGVVHSIDGVSWQIEANSQSDMFNDMAWDGGNTLVATATTGTIASSLDKGLTWQSQRRGFNNRSCITWDGAQFIAVEESAAQYMLSGSQDGYTWTNLGVTPTTNTICKDLLWDGTKLIMLTNNAIYTGPADGTAWTVRYTSPHTGIGAYFNRIIQGNGEFIVVGATGQILTSLDGITWTSQSSNTGRDLYGITWSGTQYVAVGSSATILSSGQRPPRISLIGNSPLSITQGSSFSDPGATAYDYEDGDITASITSSAVVDTGVLGTYTVSYSVTDSAGLSATVQRNIDVVPVSVSGTPSPTSNPVNTPAASGGGGCITMSSPMLLIYMLMPFGVIIIRIFSYARQDT